MNTIYFNNVYVQTGGASGAVKEGEGPLARKFDIIYDDLYCGEKSFEKAEQKLVQKACAYALKKANLQEEEIDLYVGGDLLNQLMSSHYFIRNRYVPFIGMYAACATSSLIIANASMYVEHHLAKNVIAFTSSHNATAERQFRYPNEYGVQKKETSTYTVTGAGAVLISNMPTKIKITSATIGRVIDWKFTNANDMGRAMVPAAFDTICRYFNDTKESFADFDYIVTGDLSTLGLQYLKDLFAHVGIRNTKNLYDCGCWIYNVKDQDVFCGGSGSACSMCVSITKIFEELTKGIVRRVMVVSTGALLSKVAIAQKESIPCVAHAVVYERRDDI